MLAELNNVTYESIELGEAAREGRVFTSGIKLNVKGKIGQEHRLTYQVGFQLVVNENIVTQHLVAAVVRIYLGP